MKLSSCLQSHPEKGIIAIRKTHLRAEANGKGVHGNMGTASELFSCEHKIGEDPGAYEFHLHSAFEIYFFLHGDVQYFVEKTLYELRENDVLVLNNAEVHRPSLRTKARYERFVIHFDPLLAQELSTVDTHLLDCFLRRKPGEQNLLRLPAHEQEEVRRLLEQLCIARQNSGWGMDVTARACFAQVLVALNRDARRVGGAQHADGITSPYVRGALAHIAAHLADALSLESVAKELAVDKFYLAKLFRRETGASLYNYIVLKRLSLARVLLEEGASVGDACHRAGFNDYSHFIRSFKAHTGVTPLAFARGARGDVGE